MIQPVVVIKLGGSSLVNAETLQQLMSLVQGFRQRQSKVVVVHGGGPAINRELERRGITWTFIDGQRQTTAQMMTVIDQVLGKDINSMLVQTFKTHDIQCVGLSGAHDQILSCEQSSPELMQVGKVISVNPQAMLDIIEQAEAAVPIIAPIGFGEKGELYNVNADWAATQIAISLKAKSLIFLTDQEGILDSEKKLIQEADPIQLQAFIGDGSITGGMCTKVRAMIMAIESGIEQVRVLHASRASDLLSDEKMGTLLKEAKFLQAKEVNHGRIN